MGDALSRPKRRVWVLLESFTGEKAVEPILVPDYRKTVLRAMARYGMYVADTGTNWFVSGATDARWNDDDVSQLLLDRRPPE